MSSSNGNQDAQRISDIEPHTCAVISVMKQRYVPVIPKTEKEIAQSIWSFRKLYQTNGVNVEAYESRMRSTNRSGICARLEQAAIHLSDIAHDSSQAHCR